MEQNGLRGSGNCWRSPWRPRVAEPIVGRDAIAEHFRKGLTGQPEDLAHEVTEEHIHLVTPDLANVDKAGTSGAGGRREVEAFTMIAVPDDEGEWLWAGMR